MKMFVEKGRKVLRKIYLLLGAAAISMLFAACYGMPMDDHDWDGCPYCRDGTEHPEDEDHIDTKE